MNSVPALTGTRGRPRDPELRSRALTAAAGELARRGFTAMTMEGIVASSGIAKRTLYRWWPSKSAIVTEAIVAGFVPVPRIVIPHSSNVWDDIHEWLVDVADSVRGPYGEVLRAASEIGAGDAALGRSLTAAFADPAREMVSARLQLAQRSGEIAGNADRDAVIDVVMSMVVFVGITRAESNRIPAVLRIVRWGIESKQD